MSFYWRILCLLLLSGCNSVFYYPQTQMLPPTKEDEARIERILIPVSDQEKLSAWIGKTPKKPRALLLHFHGNAENLSTHYYYVSFLADVGIEVLIFDYRGYGESLGEPSRAGTVEDGRAALRFASTRASTAKIPLFVLGQSLGGAIAVPSLALEKTPIQGLILESTFSSYRKIAREKLSGFWLTWPFQWPLSFLVSSDYQPEDYYEQLSAPTLVIHGDRDGIVDVSNAERIYDSLKTPQKDLWIIEGAGHLPTLRERNGYRSEFVAFVNKWIDAQH